jgi:hypothetical protein
MPDDMPPRARRREGHERVPEPGHAGAVPVPEREWEENNRLRGTARGHADDEAPTE